MKLIDVHCHLNHDDFKNDLDDVLKRAKEEKRSSRSGRWGGDLSLGKIAVDIVLLLPEEIGDRAIEINHLLVDDIVVLDKVDCFPHISLCMGVLEEKNLTKVAKIISNLGKITTSLNLKITGIKEQSAFDIEKTVELQQLHEQIVTKIKSFLTYDAKEPMFISPPKIEEKTIKWINKYLKNSTFKNFYPHITLGRQKPKPMELNIHFNASKLAICHLGNYCTCKKILYVVDLG